MAKCINKISRLTAFPLLLLVAISLSPVTFSQDDGKTTIKGVVTDAVTGEPLPYVSVYLKGSAAGALTDTKGKYLIETNVRANTVVFSFVGYQTESREIVPGKEYTFNIQMAQSSVTLKEVIVKPSREAYRNRDNPAVELIRRVVAKKDENRPETFDYLSYKKYEKIQFALSNVSNKFTAKRSAGKLGLLFNNIDTSRVGGNRMLPVFIKETLSEHYYRKNPEATKDIVVGDKTINLDEYIDKKGVGAYLSYLYQDVNIYDNEILFLTAKFLSPIANSAPTFYRYYIIDTLPVNDQQCIRLFFEPRNKTDFLFHGNLYVTLDSAFAVRKIDMGINENINMDWIQDIILTQDFEKSVHKCWLLAKEEISIDVGISKSSMGLNGQRTTYFRNYRVNEPVSDVFFKGPIKIDKPDPASTTPEYWESNRFVPLTKSETQIYTTIDSLKQLPAFRRRMNLVIFLTSGYLDLGKIEFGPSTSLYSYNVVEGQRVRIGMRTSTDLSKKIILEGYGAYGIDDQEFKYSGSATWSFTPRSIYQFPVKSLKVSYMKDVKIPGQELLQLLSDNLIFSIKRGVSNQFFLNKTFRIEHLNEYENHFSFLAGYSFTRQAPLGKLWFNTDSFGPGTGVRDYLDISELYLNLRYAPDETFYEGKVGRTLYPSLKPVYTLKIAGGTDFMKNDFNYLRLQLNITRRYYVSIIGYTDLTLEAGKIFGQVPYPLLFMHRANQTYTYQKQSYNMMNFLEFVSDRYVALNIDYCFNGFFFNKIPLFKNLKLREWVTFKALYGGVLDKNNPDYNANLFKFPAGSDGVPLTYTLGKKPYIEASVGIANIFNLVRIDLIKRFTYLDNPHVAELGIRFIIKLDI
jgi:hypothetical protein